MASDGDANNSSDFLNSGCAGLATVTEERHGPPKTYYSDPWFLNAKKQIPRSSACGLLSLEASG